MNKAERSRLISTLSDSAAEVMRTVGSGLESSLYSDCLLHELRIREINFRTELVLPFTYKGFRPESLIVVPIFVENEIPVMVITGSEKLQQAIARMLVLLRLANRTTGLVVDFYGEPGTGIHRVIAKLSEKNLNSN